MHLIDWNVVATCHEGHYPRARHELSRFGEVAKTDYHNVLVLDVPDARSALDQLYALWEQHPETRSWLAHFVPVSLRFRFTSPEEFDTRAAEAARELGPTLADRSFHVRMHRRGFRERISERDEEARLGDVILETLAALDKSAHVSFEDPDAVVVIETVGQRGGMALYERAELTRYPFLGLVRG